ncbi:serine-rich adhesin for platelets isoform X6 [Vespa velutina]|uniref:serine-rich adhesin for platelets isoform X6 n=1 Tax=Vespa velutina TaxID=202808 RepID=UPI001FB52D97|nr:serine-rich adhesin for platelets isoform X6 [Vespa velutina]
MNANFRFREAHSRESTSDQKLEIDWCISSIGFPYEQDEEMAKNVGESRIPLPRAARPSFFPKGRVLGGTKIGTGRRRSLVLSCLQSVNAEDDISTPIPKCSTRATSTPLSTGNTGNTIFAISPVWDIEENDVQQLVYLSEEKSNFFSLLETTGTLNRIEDVGDSCLRDVNLSSYNDNTSGTPSHYLMLNKQNSFEHDESLGILTPDQMTDFTVALECSRTPSCENLTGSGGSRVALTRASASRPSVDAEPTEEGSSERTPSPEELPLDPKPAEPARGSVVPVSFVTSVTSITSLEAGYQGDGENSRPASRGADPPSVAPPPNLPAPCRQDPMTDSDFFTESDADAHEEIVRGDRKAQVIDGTLFCAPGGRRCPSFTGEEMDSSGIYSDLDKKQDERHVPGEALDENEDHTPDTVDTEVSQRSQPSPVKPEATHVFLDFVQMSPRVLTTLDVSNEAETVLQTAEITVIEVNRANDIPRIKSSNKTESNSLKKYKMPKRNVVSKIKAMIESGPKDEAEKEARRSQRSQRKGSRWDAVMSKIEAGKNEQRTRSLRKEVKSRVLQGLTQSTSPETALQKVADVDNNNSKDNKRRTRGRQTVKSPIQETARSSVRSSMSDLSSAPSKEARKRSPTSGSSPRRIVANGRGGQQGRVNSFQEKKNCSSVATINLEKSPTVSRKQPITRRLTSNVPAKQPSQQRQQQQHQQQQQQQQQQQRATRPTEKVESRHADQLASLESNLQEERQKCEFRLNNCLNEATKEHRAEIARLRAEHEAELMRKDAETKRRSVVHDQGAALAAEVESLRSVLELKSQENAALRSELDGIRREIEDKDILQQRVEMLEARCEDLKAQLQCKEAMERQISHNNEMLHESMHQVSKQNKRLLQRNEELQWRLRQKNEVVTVLANQLASPRLSRSLGPEHIDHSLSFDKNPQQSSSMIKFVVEKSDSVSWTLDLDEAHTPMNAPPKLLTPEGSLSVSRQGSLRLTPRRTSIDTRARSKSISVTDSARTEDSTWPYTSTPVNARRRPRSDPSSSSTSSSSSSSSTTSSSSTAPANPVVAVAVAAAAAAAAAAEDCNASQTPQEAGGEAMISEETSASSSEDESSTSSDIPRLPMQFAWGKSIN